MKTTVQLDDKEIRFAIMRYVSETLGHSAEIEHVKILEAKGQGELTSSTYSATITLKARA